MVKRFEAEDHADSDDMEEILEYTKHVHQNEQRQGGTSSMGDKDRDLKERIRLLEADVHQYNKDIEDLTKVRDSKASQLEELKRQLRSRHYRPNTTATRSETGINYQQGFFDWDKHLLKKSKDVFGIEKFRLCQRGVCNANMDGRDIVCVMPTGGGKSLTYQLPALLTAGCTIIISPLISLITDQVMNLKCHGVEAVMLMSTVSNSEKSDVQRRLRAMADGSGDMHGRREIKLCYVTPERISKDGQFRGILSDLESAGKLARFVIDEAHCVSHDGHDFRPDYGKLHMLRTQFPSVPIMALSATCPPKVLEDLVEVLRLEKPVVSGEDASIKGTVYFTAPLYRKNLHYKVIPKPNKAEEVYQAMVDWILEKHQGESGIVYCFSKADSETVAEKLQTLSNNKIRTGTYHASIADGEKHRIHEAWREGQVQVVCATIAFGLGIDKGDVRFVIHHSISKSLDGYYQETGRAGRDGKDSDCVLFYRPQDATHLAGLVSSGGNRDWRDKLHALLEFVEDVKECRKILFANYFNHSSRIAITSWSTVESSALEKCGHCDNCVRSPASVVLKDVTLPAWQILRVVYEITNRMGGKVTLNMLKGLVRGKGGGKIDVAVAGGKGRGKKQQKEKVEVDLARVCGGPVGDLSGDDVEHLIVFLLIKRYLKEIIVSTSYAANVYLGTSEQAAVYTRHSRHDVEGGNKARKLELCFVKQEKPPRKPRSTAATTAPTTADGKTVPKKRKVSDRNANAKDKLEKGKDKGKARATADDEDDMYDEDNSSYLNAARKRRDARVEGSDSGGEYIDPDEGLELASDVDMDDDEHMTMPPPPPPRRPPTATTSTTKKEIVRSTARTAAQSESPSQSSMGAAGSRQANNTVASSNRQSKPARTSKPAPPEVIDIADSDDDDESDERALSRSRRAARSAPSPSPRLPPPPLLPPKRAGKPLWTEENELEYGGREDEEDVISDSEDGEDEMHQWLFNQRGTTTKSGASAAAGSGGAGPPKKRFKPNTDPPLAPPNRTAKMSGQSRKGGVAAMNEPDVIVLSDSD